jgi:hypothetical protein
MVDASAEVEQARKDADNTRKAFNKAMKQELLGLDE